MIPLHVTADGLRAYIEAFHSTLDDVSARFFSPEQRRGLAHKSLLPARITCYASTQNGVAFEYSRADSISIATVRGTSPIEDIVVRAPRRLRSIGPALRIAGDAVTVGKLTLEGAFPFRLAAKDSGVKFYDVRFSCEPLNWHRDVEYLEVYGNRLAAHWSLEAAQSRAKDEVLAALYLQRSAERKGVQIYEYVASFREKTVLLLGSYDHAGMQRLNRIADALSEAGYDPLLIRDVPDFEHYDTSQKVAVVGVVSRFVVIDDSTPSGHLVEFEVCRSHRWVTAVLRAGGQGASWMTAGASASSNVIFEASYDLQNVVPAVKVATEWAEQRLQSLAKTYDLTYPWREKH